MKKTFVLTALAATLAAPAFAQSSVTIYGRLNVTVERTKIGNADATTDINNNSSRLGFKGTEDLGGGMKAGFQLEHGFDVSTGAQSGDFWGRQSEVNLSGGFGMIRLGNFTSEAYFATSDWSDLINHGTGYASDLLYVDANITQKNKASYRTPTMGGFWGELAVLESDTNGERGYDLALNYDMGGLHLGGGFSKNASVNQFAVEALYTTGNFTFGGYIQRDKNVCVESINRSLRRQPHQPAPVRHVHHGCHRAARQHGHRWRHRWRERLRHQAVHPGREPEPEQAHQGLRLLQQARALMRTCRRIPTTGLSSADLSNIAVGMRHNF